MHIAICMLYLYMDASQIHMGLLFRGSVMAPILNFSSEKSETPSGISLDYNQIENFQFVGDFGRAVHLGTLCKMPSGKLKVMQSL